jgi:hypothetical protein
MTDHEKIMLRDSIARALSWNWHPEAIRQSFLRQADAVVNELGRQGIEAACIKRAIEKIGKDAA